MTIRSVRWGWGVAVLAVAGMFGLLAAWFRAAEPARSPTSGVVVVAAPSPTTEATPSAIAAQGTDLVRKMMAAAGTGARFSDVRIVDAERNIACASMARPGHRRPSRAVWIDSTATLVVDDGGPDFAILVGVCDPDRPGRR